jgi:hypothetical protein
MCLQTSSGENHPAWILGHLLLGDIYLLSMLNVRELSADFAGLLSKYGPASNPVSTPDDYDSKQFLVERLTETGLLRTDALRNMKIFDQPTPDETLVRTQPTIGHHLQMLVFHEGHHCGQIASRPSGITCKCWFSTKDIIAVKSPRGAKHKGLRRSKEFLRLEHLID